MSRHDRWPARSLFTVIRSRVDTFPRHERGTERHERWLKSADTHRLVEGYRRGHPWRHDKPLSRRAFRRLMVAQTGRRSP